MTKAGVAKIVGDWSQDLFNKNFVYHTHVATNCVAAQVKLFFPGWLTYPVSKMIAKYDNAEY